MTKKNRMIIGSDLDGTLVDHTELKQRLAHAQGFFVSQAECASDIMKSKMPRDTYRAIQQAVYGEASVNSSMMEGAYDVLTKMQKKFGNIYVISRRQKQDSPFAMQWLGTHLIPPLLEQDIYFVEKDEDKGIVAREKNIHIYIDDKVETLNKMPGVPHRVLMDPFDNFPKSPYPRVHNWQDFFALVKKL
jgi:hypothetical protein